MKLYIKAVNTLMLQQKIIDNIIIMFGCANTVKINSIVMFLVHFHTTEADVVCRKKLFEFCFKHIAGIAGSYFVIFYFM